jgi:hypothetical protein
MLFLTSHGTMANVTWLKVEGLGFSVEGAGFRVGV